MAQVFLAHYDSVAAVAECCFQFQPGTLSSPQEGCFFEARGQGSPRNYRSFLDDPVKHHRPRFRYCIVLVSIFRTHVGFVNYTPLTFSTLTTLTN